MVSIRLYTVEWYSTIKKNEKMPLAATRIDIEIIILSKGRQRKKNNMILFIFGIQKKKKDTNELIYKIEIDPQT